MGVGLKADGGRVRSCYDHTSDTEKHFSQPDPSLSHPKERHSAHLGGTPFVQYLIRARLLHDVLFEPSFTLASGGEHGFGRGRAREAGGWHVDVHDWIKVVLS